MPALRFSDIYGDIFSTMNNAAGELPDSPYTEIFDKLELSEFDEKLLTYIEITRAFMSEISSDVEARKLRSASAKMMAAMSESAGTYADNVVLPIVGSAAPNITALEDTDQMAIFAIGSYDDYFDLVITYDLNELGDGEDAPTNLDELVDFLNRLIEVQGGDGFGDFFQFYNAGAGLLGLRLGEATIQRQMNLIIQESPGDGATSLLTKLGFVAGSRDNSIRERAADACQRALAPYLTALRYLPPEEEGDGGDEG